MTPEIVQRSFTNDEQVFQEVFFENKYKLKGHKESGPIILDIGSHAGFSVFTELTLGARQVFAFEPFIDNFNVLLKNCYNPHFVGKVTPHAVGVYTSEIIGKFSGPNLINNLFFDMAKIGLCTKSEEHFYPAPCFTLDTILEKFCFNEKIDILKVNLGDSLEREVLLGSNKLQENVKCFCGEMTVNDIQLMEFKKHMVIQGFVNFVSNSMDANGRTLFWGSKTALSENFVGLV